MERSDVTPELIRELLDCDYETGALTWRTRPLWRFAHCKHPETQCNRWNGRYAGQEAFTHVTKRGYREGGLMGTKFFRHRIVWAHYYGKWPKNEVDHIHGKEKGDGIKNLRDATSQQNSQNMKTPNTNKSGQIGVFWDNTANKWGSGIRAEGKYLNLGRYDLKQDAIDARKAAERRYGYHENHGR